MANSPHNPPRELCLSVCHIKMLHSIDLRYHSDGYSFISNKFHVILTWYGAQSIEATGAPLWSLITRTVIPVVGLLKATKPSLPPDSIIHPGNLVTTTEQSVIHNPCISKMEINLVLVCYQNIRPLEIDFATYSRTIFHKFRAYGEYYPELGQNYIAANAKAKFSLIFAAFWCKHTT